MAPKQWSAALCVAYLRTLSSDTSVVVSTSPELLVVLRVILEWLVDRVPAEEFPVADLVHLYRRLDSTSSARGVILKYLALRLTAASCAAVAELLAEDPPRDDREVGQVLSVFFQRDALDPAWLFPRLMDAMSHSSAAASVLDLANFLVRRGRLAPHPVRHRREALRFLLTRTVRHLAQLATSSATAQPSAEQVARQVNEGVALAIAICNSLGLDGDSDAIESLRQAAALPHRQLRLAAAEALARLDDDAGRDLLVELSAEPIVREAVLQAAEELQIAPRIPAEYCSPLALAEARFVNYLAQPVRFALPPVACELCDERVLRWPGCDAPVSCYLFEFTYHFPQGVFRNVGMAGPVTATFPLALGDWGPAAIYALVAGWQTEHEDMQAWDYATAPEELRQQTRLHLRRLQQSGDYLEVQPRCVARFWDEWHLVAEASLATARDTVSGTVVVNNQGEARWFPRGDLQRPLEWQLAYACYKGRLLLEAFNPPEMLS